MRSSGKGGQFFRDHGLSLTMLAFFMVFIGGQAIAGCFELNEERAEHGRSPIGFGAYLGSGHFLEGVFENWESEFLQMGMYVLLTAFLFQRGSAESNDPDAREKKPAVSSRSPWPVRLGGRALQWYRHSLSLALLALFAISFLGHWLAGHAHVNAERLQHDQPAISHGAYLGSARFWYESLQNWQSEFLAVFAIVVLSIWLREDNSPESKPVTAPHRQTGK